jgi:UDP-glucose 4-epimerase
VRVLITGGAGFIGAALANRLVELGHQVRVLDDLSAGDPSHLHDEVLFSRGDVRDRPKLWTILHNIDCVFHLAARVSVPESVLYPREYNDVNVAGTVSVMEAMRDVGVKRVVLASSGTVYGEQPTQPVKETITPNPDAPYSVSKIAAEYYVSTLGRLYDIETVALRIFNAYGPAQPLPPSHAPVIPLFLRQVLSGGSVVLFGGGAQTRDFVYIDDVVDALVRAATAPNVNRRIINVGSGTEVSIRQLLRHIEQVSGRQANVIDSANQAGGVSRLVASIDLARDLLGFRPRVDIRHGLQLLLEKDARFRSI